MTLKNLWGTVTAKVTSKRTLRTAGMIVGVLAIFGLGVLAGNGQLRLVPNSGYGNRTGLPANLDYSSLNQLYDALRGNYDGTLTEDQVLDGLKHGLAKSANDPYTEYFTPAEARDFNGQLQGISLTGIGAELDKDADGNLIVVAPIDGSPAQAAGIQARDVILTIDGQSTADMSTMQAVQKIRGAKGTKVTLKVLRGGDQQLTFTIIRDTISVPTATSKILDGNIGYIRISQFSTSSTYGLVKQAVQQFKAAGVTKLILDLRDNPGGEVDSAQDIASLWLPKNAMIMEERRGTKVIDEYRANGNALLKGMPTVVLVNNGSASAAEITALALRDHKAATIIGEKSYGKGVVQQVIPFDDGSELKVTIARWYSPKGTNVTHKGITPDQTVALSDQDAKAGNDPQLQAAQTYLQSH